MPLITLVCVYSVKQPCCTCTLGIVKFTFLMLIDGSALPHGDIYLHMNKQCRLICRFMASLSQRLIKHPLLTITNCTFEETVVI